MCSTPASTWHVTAIWHVMVWIDRKKKMLTDEWACFQLHKQIFLGIFMNCLQADELNTNLVMC